MSATLAPDTKCHSGVTGLPTDHLAEGWVCSPDGKRIQSMCREHAANVIREYGEKLGQQWTFEVPSQSASHDHAVTCSQCLDTVPCGYTATQCRGAGTDRICWACADVLFGHARTSCDWVAA